MTKIKNIIEWIPAVIVVTLITAFIIFVVIQCSSDLNSRREYEIQYGIEHPVCYEITFKDSYKDTITVWTSPYDGDRIEMTNNGGTFTRGEIVLCYISWRKYTRTDPRRTIYLYNVLYYRKLR